MTTSTDTATARQVMSELKPEVIAKILEVFESDPTAELEFAVTVKMNSIGRNVPFTGLKNGTSVIFHLEDLKDMIPELQVRIAAPTSPA